MARPLRDPSDPTVGKKLAVFPVRFTEAVEMDIYRRAARSGLVPAAYLRKLVLEAMYGVSSDLDEEDQQNRSDFAPL